MKCSNCKLEGYNKNNCPNCQEKNEERINRLIEILPTETVFVSLAYFSLSQTIQKQGPLSDFAGSGGDLLALRSPNAGIVLGGMLSLAYEAGTEGWLERAEGWLERQGLTKEGFEGLFGGKGFVQI